jgi:predicted O-methyltransferase YrrM
MVRRSLEKLLKGSEIFKAICNSKQTAIGHEIEKRRLLFTEDKRILNEVGVEDFALEASVLSPHEEGLTIAGCAESSRPRRDCQFLYSLPLFLHPRTCLELGTNIGISSAYLAAGLRETGGGRLVTLEASPVRVMLSRQLHSHLGLPDLDCRPGLFKETLLSALQSLGSAELVFVDGDHQYEATLNYWNVIAPFCPIGSIVVFDDTRWSEGMLRAWDELKRDKRFSGVIDLGWMGLCIVGNGPGLCVEASAIY